MSEQLWIRVGDSADYEPFDGLNEAIEYLNDLQVGQVDHWIDGGPGIGFATPNYHGFDFISCFWGDNDAQLTRSLNARERAALEMDLEEVYI